MTVAFASTGSIISSASAAALTPVRPSSNAGDVFFAMIAILSNATINTPAGWSKLFQTNSGVSFTAALYEAAATGSSNPAFTWTGSVACAAQIVRFVGTKFPANGANGGPVAGTTNPHTSTALTTTFNNSLAVAFDFQSSATAQPSVPAGWSSLFANGDATSAIAFAAWGKTINLSGTSSGAISQNQTAVAWVEDQMEALEDALPGQVCV